MGLFGLFKKKEPASTNEPHTAPVQNAPASAALSPKNNDGVLQIEKRIRGKAPACDGLHPHEILVLSYAPKYCDRNNEFPGFWWYKYGIRDVQGVLDSLCKRGYIRIGGISDAISLEKLPAIKDELQKRGLKASGKKAELVARLVESVPEEELGSIFARRPYALTERGEKALKDFEWIPYIHQHGIEGLDIWNLTEMVQTPPYMKYRDKIWGYLNQRGMEHAGRRDFGLYRNCRFAMSEFVSEEGKDETAFSLLCEVVAYDLSGLSNGFNIENVRMSASSYFPYERSIATVPPGVTARIKTHAEKHGLADRDLRARIESEISKLRLPFSLFTAAECADIVLAEIHEDKAALNAIYDRAEKSLKRKLK